MKYCLTPEQQKKVNELKAMSPERWETICKRCGICCLCKVGFGVTENEPTFYTKVHCECLNPRTKKCKVYKNRLKSKAKDCKKLDLDIILDEKLLPRTCGYVEYIFGPAPFNIFIDWKSVKSEKQVNLNNPDNVVKNIIMESYKWNEK